MGDALARLCTKSLFSEVVSMSGGSVGTELFGPECRCCLAAIELSAADYSARVHFLETRCCSYQAIVLLSIGSKKIASVMRVLDKHADGFSSGSLLGVILLLEK